MGQRTRKYEFIEVSRRPEVRGKFLYSGNRKLQLRGVTYGTFHPDSEGVQFPSRDVVARDFAQMAACGINAVRTYTAPPRWLLDLALSHGLFVMAGLPWEQHIAFLDDAARVRSIRERVRQAVCGCAGHPAVLAYTIGNEIPASIVRWHGARRVERFLEGLHRAAKQEDPRGLFTYVNFPTTEYLRLPFLDFVCFNVYLESEERLAAYLARLQNLAGEKPLVMAEVGLDSRRNGLEAQASTLQWQVRAAFDAGCAGLFVFAWTDEWYRGGYDIEDWDFGLTDRRRRPKPALRAVREAFAEAPFPADLPWPYISVVVCSHNGSRTIAETLETLTSLDYPGYEVIVIDDGSTDRTGEIAAGYPVRLIRTTNRGLSAARNAGLKAARGEIVAYIDDDAYPDPHWLHYLAYTFMTSDHAGVGGPNLPPTGDGVIAECVANSPGGPVHVLLSDREAEHIPGCNCAFRKERLEAIGGFDPHFRNAGDDVDVCWRLQHAGWTLGFHPGAVVWHHRRNSLRTYWRQQKGYGRAEALLERKWPEKYNGLGHLAWTGRLYGKGFTEAPQRWRIYHGTWGSALFQSLYERGPGTLASLPLTPEWHLLNVGLVALVLIGFEWRPFLYLLPLFAISALVPVFYAVRAAWRAPFAAPSLGRRALTAMLHIIQPVARLYGRLNHGLAPWRMRGSARIAIPRRAAVAIWSETWRPPAAWLESLETALRAAAGVVRRGGDFDAWDLELRGGLLGGVRVLMAVEEHGAGRQLARFRFWPKFSPGGVMLAALLAALGAAAILAGARVPAAFLGAAPAMLVLQVCRHAAAADAALRSALKQVEEEAGRVRKALERVELQPKALEQVAGD